MKSQLLRGRTWHCRHFPQTHAFAYPMVWLCVDLDELPTLNRQVSGFGYNRRAPFTIYDVDYASPGKLTIRQKVIGLLQREGISDPIARMDLITLPKVLGYAFNPVSFYRCYAADGALAVLVAEVANTFGERHHYVLQPAKRTGAADEPLIFRCPKAFYVSPFNRVEGAYEVRWLETADSLWLEIDVLQASQLVMRAGMSGQLSPLNTRSLMTSALGLPVAVVGVVPRIGWQALQLYLRKRTPLFIKPAPASDSTIPARRPTLTNRLVEYLVRLAAGKIAAPGRMAAGYTLSKENSL